MNDKDLEDAMERVRALSKADRRALIEVLRLATACAEAGEREEKANGA